MVARLQRTQVPVEQTWNLDDIYATPEQWSADAALLEEDVATLTAYSGTVREAAGSSLACLQIYDRAATRLHRMRRYAYFALATDGGDARYQALSARGDLLAARLEAAWAALKTELAALPERLLEPGVPRAQEIAPYRPLLEQLARERDHLLSPVAETALAALGTSMATPQNIWQMGTAVDLACPPVYTAAGEEIPVSLAGYPALAQSPDRALRRDSYRALVTGLDHQKATLGTALGAHITQNVALARLRGFSSATEMILDRQQVPATVYHQVLDVVHDEIAPHVRRLLRLRARVLELDRLECCDLEAPLDPGCTPATTLPEATRLIQEALAPLGDEYATLLRAAFTGRWIDTADNAGKRSGAFCWPVYGVHPYVFLTWRDTLRNAFTLAHELGHGVHYTLSLQHQRVSTFSQEGVTLIVEAPSTANELILSRHLLDAAQDPRLRRWLILQSTSTFLHNMVTHMLEGHFERRLYALAEQNIALTPSVIMDVQGEVFSRFYDDTVVIDAGARLYWAQQPHFYMNLFPYSYAAGLATGYGVVTAIRTEGRPAVERWLAMLRLGSTRPPLELARVAGIELADPATLCRAVAHFGTLVDELEQSFA